MLNGLDLFSGIGGITLALEPWVRPVAYCENDRYTQAVLFSRMAEGRLPLGPIWDDVRTLRGSMCGPVDIIYGGFPCQDISIAGTASGLGGKRSGLFFEVVRLVGECRPEFIFLENVPVITVRGLDRVLLEFTALGYDCRWTIISAAEMGAPHLRERWFLLAHANGQRDRKGRTEQGLWGRDTDARSHGGTGHIARTPARKIEPRVDRTGDGIPFRVDRGRGVGNAVYSAQAYEGFRRLMGLPE